MNENIFCGGFIFHNQFDSANLAKVEEIPCPKNNRSFGFDESHSYEFNILMRQDCQGTEYEKNNKSWFYFGIKACTPGVIVRLNLMNLNKQSKMFNQGMTPVYKTIPGHPKWERIKEKPIYSINDATKEFKLSFSYRTPENTRCITYFAFTYPFSYSELQLYLKKIDTKMIKLWEKCPDDIYYCRECAIMSLENRRLDVITISSYYNILAEREEKLKGLFPLEDQERPFKFRNKKIIFISARVHPGETPGSFVFNGFLKLLLNRENQIAVLLRRLYVFKLIPMLNPDGVANGHYRLDTRGVNLNRVYTNPSRTEHPTIFAAKALLRYYHTSYEGNSAKNVSSEVVNNEQEKTVSSTNFLDCEKNKINGPKNKHQTLDELIPLSNEENERSIKRAPKTLNNFNNIGNKNKSSLCLYIDLHGHATKKGIFMYGNHFKDINDSTECMLLPKLMSLNNSNFHFSSCNFTEKNMYFADKRDGMSREGTGRVAVYKLTGLIHSYTLECNYNTGRIVNSLPSKVQDDSRKLYSQVYVPPKYTPAIYEEVGASLGSAILDMTEQNPNSRIPNSSYRNLTGIREYLKLLSEKNSPKLQEKDLEDYIYDTEPFEMSFLQSIENKTRIMNNSSFKPRSIFQKFDDLKNTFQKNSSYKSKENRSSFSSPVKTNHQESVSKRESNFDSIGLISAGSKSKDEKQKKLQKNDGKSPLVQIKKPLAFNKIIKKPSNILTSIAAKTSINSIKIPIQHMKNNTGKKVLGNHSKINNSSTDSLRIMKKKKKKKLLLKSTITTISS